MFSSFSILLQYLKGRARDYQGSGQDISKIRNQTSWNCPGASEPEQTCKCLKPRQSCPAPCKGTKSLGKSQCSPSTRADKPRLIRATQQQASHGTLLNLTHNQALQFRRSPSET